MLIVSWFLCGMLYAMFYCYLFSELINENKFILNKKIVISLIIFGIMYVLIMQYGTEILKPYLVHILYYILLKFNYRKSFFNTLIGLFCCILTVLASELLYGIFTIVFLKIDINGLNKISYGYLFSNIIILLISLTISKVNKIKKFFSYIVNWYNKNEFKSLVVFVTLVLTIATFILYNNFVNILPSSILWLTNLFCICVMVFVIGFFKEKSNNNRIITEYDNLLNYVKVYEDEIEEKSKNQHEYKNQLLVIKGMLGTRNKKIIKYIDDKLDKEKGIEDKSWLGKLKYVPQGGLKGLIYYKIQEMIKKDIQVFVDVSPQLENINTKTIDKNLEDISKVMGVYLDNAIEAVKDLKEKYIIIELYLENKNIVFSLSNNYNGMVDISKVDKEGYTTKGRGHGYGLSLVKDIISKNDKLNQKRELNGIYYVQKLYIKK